MSPITPISKISCVNNLSTPLVFDLSGIDDKNNSICNLTPRAYDLCTPVLSDCIGFMDANSFIETNPTSVSYESSSTSYININLNQHAKPFVPQTPCAEILTETMDNASGDNT